MLACGSDPQPAHPPGPFEPLAADRGFPGVAGNEADFESIFKYDTIAECAPMVPRLLDAKTELRIFRHNSITDADVKLFLGGLRRYYDRYGVRMFTRYKVINVPYDHILTLDLKAIIEYVSKRTSLDPASTQLTADQQKELTKLFGEAAFFNIREFMKAYGQPRLNQVSVWLLPQIATGKGDPELEMLSAGIAGLGLSPELIDTAPPDDPSRLLYDWVGYPSFTPMAAVGVNLTRTHLRYPDFVIAHEVGHAYGLVHTMMRGNLLNPGASSCSESLSSEQLDQIEQATRRSGLTFGPAWSLTGRAHFVVDAIQAAIRRQQR